MELKSIKIKSKKRIGRGLSSGQGKTAGRGTKGQRSRSGFNIPKKFEGGQTPLSMRLPVLPGFKSVKRKAEVVSLDQISANFKTGEIVTIASLVEKKLASGKNPIKVLNNGKLEVAAKLGDDIKVSETVKAIFEKAIVAKPKTEKTVESVEPEAEKAELKPAKPKAAAVKKPATKAKPKTEK